MSWLPTQHVTGLTFLVQIGVFQLRTETAVFAVNQAESEQKMKTIQHTPDMLIMIGPDAGLAYTMQCLSSMTLCYNCALLYKIAY